RLTRYRGLRTEARVDHSNECIINAGIELFSYVDAEVFQGCKRRHRVTVCTVVSKGVECVGVAKNSGAERNVFPYQTQWIACAIPMFVVVLDVLERLPDVKERRKDVETYFHMLFDVLEFFSS